MRYINFFNIFKKKDKSVKIPEIIHVGAEAQFRLDKLDMVLPTGPLYSNIAELATKENDTVYIHMYKICGIPTTDDYTNSGNDKYISVYVPYGLFECEHYTSIRWAKTYKDYHFILKGVFHKYDEGYEFIENGGLYILENITDREDVLFTYSKAKDSSFYIKKGKLEPKQICINLNDLQKDKTEKSKFIAIYDENNDNVIESYIEPSCALYNEVFNNHPYLLYKDNGKYYITEVY